MRFLLKFCDEEDVLIEESPDQEMYTDRDIEMPVTLDNRVYRIKRLAEVIDPQEVYQRVTVKPDKD